MALKAVLMPNTYFQFKQFTIHQDKSAMKVTTDGCLFGAWAASRIASSGLGLQGLDIGAGTGLTSLMVAQQNPGAHIDAIELEANAVDQAMENSRNSPWSGNIAVHHANVNEFAFSRPYDFIVSNPPFYENELKSRDEKRKLAHHDGLSLPSLLHIIRKNLAPQGRYYLSPSLQTNRRDSPVSRHAPVEDCGRNSCKAIPLSRIFPGAHTGKPFRRRKPERKNTRYRAGDVHKRK